jgi:aspartate carbamoyltransferase catalytic subunit
MDLQSVKFDGWPHIVDTRQFKRDWVENILFPLADRMEKMSAHGLCDGLLTGKEMISLFVGESLRTRASFDIAIRRLGGKTTFESEAARKFSSMAKGESLEDTIAVLNEYGADVIVLRHDEEGGAEKAAAISRVPIINAGDGTGQHPTQALLDLYAVKKHKGEIDGNSFAMVGGLAGNRAVCSLAYQLAGYKVKIYFVSPEDRKIKSGIKEYLSRCGIEIVEVTDIREIAPFVDVFYQTRTQTNLGDGEWDRTDESHGFTVINKQVLGLMKPDSIILHPLPCTTEIVRAEVDSDSRAVYLKTKNGKISQVKGGLYIRMALLLNVISPEFCSSLN